MSTYTITVNKACKLLNKLKNDIETGRRQLIENYGQKEIRLFSDKYLINDELTYQEICKIRDILDEVSLISL